MKTKAEIPSHELADIFPLMSDAELTALAEDIKRNGLREPITTLDGKILDGRNRHRACLMVKVEPRFKEFRNGSPLDFVISENIKRRHLTPSQLAACAVDCLERFEIEAKERQRMSDGRGKKGTAKMPDLIRGDSRDKAAAQFGVGQRYVSDAKAIRDTSPTLFAQVRSGTIDLSEAKRQIGREAHFAKVESAKLNRGEPQGGPFDIILADPPWRYDFAETTSREVENHYKTATVEEIIAHKAHLNAKPDSVLFLWAPAPKIREALDVVEAWGFHYATHAVWDKDKPGMGYWFRNRHEDLIVATRGKFSPPPECARVSSIFTEARKGHSQKPTCVFEWIEAAFPGRAYLEMYSRKPRPGWSAWGDEVSATPMSVQVQIPLGILTVANCA